MREKKASLHTLELLDVETLVVSNGVVWFAFQC